MRGSGWRHAAAPHLLSSACTALREPAAQRPAANRRRGREQSAHRTQGKWLSGQTPGGSWERRAGAPSRRPKRTGQGTLRAASSRGARLTHDVQMERTLLEQNALQVLARAELEHEVPLPHPWRLKRAVAPKYGAIGQERVRLRVGVSPRHAARASSAQRGNRVHPRLADQDRRVPVEARYFRSHALRVTAAGALQRKIYP